MNLKTARRRIACMFALFSALTLRANAAEIARPIPKTLPSHPGNIFVAGEPVNIPAPPGEVSNWRMLDYSNTVIAKGAIKDGRIDLGTLPVGYYKIVRGAPGLVTNRTYLAVLEPLHAPTPTNSPIGIDVAMAWFFPESKQKMQDVARLCSLAGINRVRDRLMWGEVEPHRGEFAAHTRYDDSADVQHAEGLRVLQVCHVSAPWANTNMSHFPPDLRDIYNFYKSMAARWEGKLEAFEPWNEADLVEFGGHTGSEMATLQKAAYLGLKAGNPHVVACMNVFGIRRPETLADFYANEAWPYYDTYNLHHYEPLEKYPSLYADHRAVSGGKPIWVTECSVHVHWHGDEKYKELSDADLKLQSERLTKTFTLGLHEGIQAMFYFVLPHYSEHKLQYGLLHADLTPRPGYVALAAAGRFLAGARPLGSLKGKDGAWEGYVFDSLPDGKPTHVLVAWSESEAVFELPAPGAKCYDHLGRVIDVHGNQLKLGTAPVYVLLPDGATPKLTPPPTPAKLLSGTPSPIVIQALFPEKTISFTNSSYVVEKNATITVPIYVYNFGSSTKRGTLKVDAPDHWSSDLARDVEVAPGERKEVMLTLTPPKNSDWTDARIAIHGDFGKTDSVIVSWHCHATQPIAALP